MSGLLTWLAAVDGGYPWIKAFHLISVIFWIAGMLMLARLFAYHHASSPGGEAETILTSGEQRLLKLIVNPAMALAWLMGLAMIALHPELLSQGWFHAKLLLVVLLSGFHGFLAASARKFAGGMRPLTERRWRMLNEVPAVATIFVVLLAIPKPF